mmetsp:Transcript_3213/g.7116  ORF Transcript_3213/g.7116 Transcript_3213/m.7116 type:complete len:92 (+) Transcript_3213:311-586(+)
MILCSSKIALPIADPADRVTPEDKPMMLIECMEEGTIHWSPEIEMDRSLFLNVGTKLGEVVDEDEDEGDADEEEWTWQAYFHDNSEVEDQS